MPRVDIGIPCYNYGRFLRDCATSVLSQSLADIRVLIVDNASTDDSLAVARQIAAEDRRVEILAHRENCGPHASYNACIDWAASDYFLLLDADDLLAPGALERAVELMDRRPDIAFTYGRELRLEFGAGSLPRMIEPEPSPQWQISSGRDFIQAQVDAVICSVGASTVIRRTSAQKAAGPYRSTLKFADDWELWMRLATFGGAALTPAVQAIRRLHPHTHSTAYDQNPVDDFIEREAALRSFFATEGRGIPERDALMRRAQRNLAALTYWSGLSHLARGHRREGMSLLKFCFQRRPSALVLPPVAHLGRMNNPFERVKDIVLEAVTGRPHGRWLRERKAIPVVFEARETKPSDRAVTSQR